MSETIRIRIRDYNINEVWTWEVRPSMTVGEFKKKVFSFTNTPMRLSLWLENKVLINYHRISHYDITDGTELKIHDSTRFHKIPIIILIDTPSPPEIDDDQWPSVDISVSKMNTILDIKRILQTEHSPQVFGYGIDELEISEVTYDSNGDRIMTNGQEQAFTPRVPLEDAKKIEELMFDVENFALWVKKVA